MSKRIEDRHVSVNLSLHPEVLRRLDSYAKASGLTRSDAVTRLVNGKPGVQRPVDGKAAQMTIADDLCPHNDKMVTKLQNGMWRCECGQSSVDRGKTWRTP